MCSPQLARSKDVIDAWKRISDSRGATVTGLEISQQVASMFPPMSPWEVLLTVAHKTDQTPTTYRPAVATGPNAD